MKRCLIVGATSAIAEETGRILAREGARLVLAARDRAKLEAVAADLALRGAQVEGVFPFDALDPEGFEALVARADEALGGFDHLLVAHGVLPPPGEVDREVHERLASLRVNAGSVIGLLTAVAPRMKARGTGVIAVIGSVAGDRGRRSNYEYGAAKAAVHAYLEGLRAELAPAGVRVLTIKPGRVDTPMTRDFEKGALWATAPQVARGMVRAMERRQGVVYLPGIWRWIMLVLRVLPESLFRRLPL